MSRPCLLIRLRRDLRERFVTFEAFNGAFIYIPWGWGFFYYGFPWGASIAELKLIVPGSPFGYNYALMSVGIVLMIWGFRKATVNRIKQAAAKAVLIDNRVKENAAELENNSD